MTTKSGWFIGLIYWVCLLDYKVHNWSLEITFSGDQDNLKQNIFRKTNLSESQNASFSLLDASFSSQIRTWKAKLFFYFGFNCNDELKISKSWLLYVLTILPLYFLSKKIKDQEIMSLQDTERRKFTDDQFFWEDCFKG